MGSGVRIPSPPPYPQYNDSMAKQGCISGCLGGCSEVLMEGCMSALVPLLICAAILVVGACVGGVVYLLKLLGVQ